MHAERLGVHCCAGLALKSGTEGAYALAHDWELCLSHGGAFKRGPPMWQQVADGGGVCRHALCHIFEPGLRITALQFAGAQQRVDDGSALGCFV